MSRAIDRSQAHEKRREKGAKHGRPTRGYTSQLPLMQDQGPTRIPVKPSSKPLRPLTKAQAEYDVAILSHTLTFGMGPAGTGKTWWAAMRAAEALKEGRVERIIVTRPAVEAGGEGLGFLPGELDEKYEPYFRPVREALEESLGSGFLEYAMKVGKIEARPLALLRGSTLKNAWVIADEMQNATIVQMKLLLTRIGENAKFIINGDPGQCDLPDASKSGLEDAIRRLAHVNSVASVTFTEDDVVRSGICQDIVRAYSSRPTATPSFARYNENEIDDRAGLHRLLGVSDVGEPDLFRS